MRGEFSNEDFEEGKRGMLKKATCGTRDAVQKWELEYAEIMTEAGFRQGSLCTRLLARAEERPGGGARRLRSAWTSKSLDWVRGVVQQRMEVKSKGSLERSTLGVVQILHWIATVTENGLEYEAD